MRHKERTESRRNFAPKRKTLLTAALMVLCIGILCGCGNDNPNTGTEADDSLITELYNESGSYTDALGNDYAYSWHVPQIKADTEDAKELNQYIKNIFGAYVESEKELMEKKASLHYTDIGWQSYRQGNRIFLKLTAADGSECDMDAVCYDFDLGKRIETGGILADLGVDEETYLKALRRAVLNVYDSRYTDNMKRREFYNDGGFALRAQTIGVTYLSAERPVYISDEKQLIAIVPVASMAGASWYLEEIPVDLEKAAGRDLHAEDGFITADLKDGTLTVKFRENEDAEYIFGSMKKPPEYDKEYAVEGIYGAYQEMVLANLGNSINPYLFLLTSEGRVEFVDLANGMRSGYYCSGGVLPKTTDVRHIEAKVVSEEGGAYQTAVSVNGKGKEKDLTSYVFAMQDAIESSLNGRSWHTQVTHLVEGGNSYKEDYWVEFRDDHSLRIDNAAAEGTIHSRYNGSYDYLGMSADGLIAAWNAKEKGKNKTRYQGVWALEIYPLAGEALTVEYKAGSDFFDNEEGEFTYWEVTVG